MSFAWSSCKKDFARWQQDYVATLVWVAIPLLIGGLLTALVGGEVKPHGVLLMVDEDQSFLSELIVGAYGAGELGELISVEETTYEEGLARVNDGGASALLVVPDGFARAFLESEPVTLTLRTNPSQTILPGIITNVTEILLDAGFYLHQVFDDEIASVRGMDDAPADAVVGALAIRTRDKFESVAASIDPPLIDIEIVEPPAEEPSPPVALLFMPGIIVMAVLFAANGLAGDFWRERVQGTLSRLAQAPGVLSGFIAGKSLAVAAVVGLVGGFTLVLGFLYHGVSWQKLPVALAWICVSGVALFAWFAVLQMSFSSQKAANLVSSALLFPLLMTGGSFFPLSVMPGWIATIGMVSPNGFVAARLTTLVTEAGASTIDLYSWLIVVAAAAMGLSICHWRLGSGFVGR
jgi:hypothetical protein